VKVFDSYHGVLKICVRELSFSRYRKLYQEKTISKQSGNLQKLVDGFGIVLDNIENEKGPKRGGAPAGQEKLLLTCFDYMLDSTGVDACL